MDDRKRGLFLTAIMGLSGLVFVLDLLIPLGIVVWVLYLPVILTSVRLKNPRYIMLTGAGCSVLTAVGWFLSQPGIPPAWGLTNRVLGLVAIWFTALAGLVVRRRTAQLGETNAALQREITERRRSEEALRAGEERFRVALQHSPIVVFNQDRDLRYTWVHNPQLGFTAEEVLGKTDGDLFSAQEASQLTAFKRRVLETGLGARDEISIVKGGQKFSYDLTVEPLRDGSGQIIGITGAVMDITARRRAEEGLRRLNEELERHVAERTAQLQRREHEFRTLVANVPALFSYIDAGQRYRHVNRRYEELFRMPASEIVGKSVQELLGPQRYAVAQPHIAAVLSGEQVNYELEFPDGTHTMDVTYVPDRDEQGRVKGFFALINDITKLKRAEQGLREGEARLRAILHTAADAVIIIDERGIIDSVNAAAEQMFGYSATEMIGQNVKMLMPPHYREQHDGFLARYLLTGEKRILCSGREVEARRKDGSTFPVDLSVSEFHDRTQHMFTGLLRDISARKQLEREVLEVATMEQWRIGEELHDRTGQELTALGLLAEGLVEALAKSSPNEAVLATKIAEGLKRVLGQVRALSRGLIPVEVDAAGLMAALAELTSQTSELHGVTCTFDCGEPVLVEDNQTATHLFRIAKEAVTNALKHSRAKNITISLEGDERSVTLCIRDDGVGFPRGPVEIKGMGLKIMRYRAGLINARLVVASAEPAGTIVSCTLNKGPNRGQEQDQNK